MVINQWEEVFGDGFTSSSGCIKTMLVVLLWMEKRALSLHAFDVDLAITNVVNMWSCFNVCDFRDVLTLCLFDV